MSFLLQAPYPLLQSSLLLPSPRLGNQQNLASSVQSIRSMNGVLYTYIKPKRSRMVYQWDFLGTKDKGRETVEFVNDYAGGLVKITDHEEVQRIGYITINPIELSGNGRAGGYPSGEVYRWTISFEEKV